MWYAFGAIVGLLIGLLIFSIVRKSNAKKTIYKTLENYFDSIQKSPYKNIEYLATKDNKNYLIKIIYNFSNAEINVNSKYYWQINHGTVSSRKSGEQMKNVYDLLETNFEGTRLHIIYPSSKNLMKVINECEMVMIKPNTDIYGTRIIPFDKFDEQIKDVK